MIHSQVIHFYFLCIFREDKNAKNIKQYLPHIPEEQIAKFQKFDYKIWNLEIAQKLQETESMPDRLVLTSLKFNIIIISIKILHSITIVRAGD